MNRETLHSFVRAVRDPLILTVVLVVALIVTVPRSPEAVSVASLAGQTVLFGGTAYALKRNLWGRGVAFGLAFLGLSAWILSYFHLRYVVEQTAILGFILLWTLTVPKSLRRNPRRKAYFLSFALLGMGVAVLVIDRPRLAARSAPDASTFALGATANSSFDGVSFTEPVRITLTWIGGQWRGRLTGAAEMVPTPGTPGALRTLQLQVALPDDVRVDRAVFDGAVRGDPRPRRVVVEQPRLRHPGRPEPPAPSVAAARPAAGGEGGEGPPAPPATTPEPPPPTGESKAGESKGDRTPGAVASVAPLPARTEVPVPAVLDLPLVLAARRPGSFEVDFAWRPPAYTLRLGEQRLVFNRDPNPGHVLDRALPLPTEETSPILAITGDFPVVELLGPSPTPLASLPDRVEWRLRPAAPDSTLLQVTLVDRRLRFLTDQAVDIIILGGGVLIGLLVEPAGGGRAHVPGGAGAVPSGRSSQDGGTPAAGKDGGTPAPGKDGGSTGRGEDGAPPAEPDENGAPPAERDEDEEVPAGRREDGG